MEIHRSQKSPGGTQIIFLKKNDNEIKYIRCKYNKNGLCIKEKASYNSKCMEDSYCNYYQESKSVTENYYNDDFETNKYRTYNKNNNQPYEKINFKEEENLKYIYEVYCEELDETNHYYFGSNNEIINNNKNLITNRNSELARKILQSEVGESFSINGYNYILVKKDRTIEFNDLLIEKEEQITQEQIKTNKANKNITVNRYNKTATQHQTIIDNLNGTKENNTKNLSKYEFKKWMMSQKRWYNGVYEYYSEQAVDSRIVCLQQLEWHFKISIDEKVKNVQTGIQFLKDIRAAKIEDLAHTPLSNAFRHYFEFATGIYIDKIF